MDSLAFSKGALIVDVFVTVRGVYGSSHSEWLQKGKMWSCVLSCWKSCLGFWLKRETNVCVIWDHQARSCKRPVAEEMQVCFVLNLCLNLNQNLSMEQIWTFCQPFSRISWFFRRLGNASVPTSLPKILSAGGSKSTVNDLFLLAKTYGSCQIMVTGNCFVWIMSVN